MANEEQRRIDPSVPLKAGPPPAGEGVGARREDDLDRVRNLERQIVQVDAEIDQRVYALYGLTEAEIKIVER
jgi:hypothetical protein